MRGFGHASAYTRTRCFVRRAFWRMASNSRRICTMRRSAGVARSEMRPRSRMSRSMSARLRGFLARKFSGCSSSLATVSCLKGTEPMTRVGFSAMMSATLSICQQSPSCGKPRTSATAVHHLVTPTNDFRAPIAHRIDVALGARDTMRSAGWRPLWRLLIDVLRG